MMRLIVKYELAAVVCPRKIAERAEGQSFSGTFRDEAVANSGETW